MTTLYMLAYFPEDCETASEAWHVEYTPIEAYSTFEWRWARKQVLNKALDGVGNPLNYRYVEWTIVLNQGGAP